MKYLLLYFSLLCPFVSWAQITLAPYNAPDAQKVARLTPPDTIDTKAQLEVFYQQLDVDTVIHMSEDNLLVLQLSEEHTQYRAYGKYRSDSLYYVKKGKPLVGEFRDTYAGFSRRPEYEVVRDLSNNLFSESTRLLMNHYRADDSTVVMNWQMHPDTLRVCELLCHKATTHFRGHDWTAWWTEEVPIDAGPWKFHGLPGLVLKAQDAKGLHLIEATAMRQALLPTITRENRRIRHISHKALLEEIRDTAINYIEHAKALGLFEVPKNAPKRHFYSPYEDIE